MNTSLRLKSPNHAGPVRFRAEMPLAVFVEAAIMALANKYLSNTGWKETAESGISGWSKADGAIHGEPHKKKPEIALRLLPLTGGLSFLLYGGVCFFL